MFSTSTWALSSAFCDFSLSSRGLITQVPTVMVAPTLILCRSPLPSRNSSMSDLTEK